jgi:methylated-DNA-[protein]-cysteine S-methyltransferase
MTKINTSRQSIPNVDNAPDEAIMAGLLRNAHSALERKLAFIRRPEAAVGVISTALGRLLVAEGPRGLVMVHYLDHGAMDGAISELRQKFDPVEDAHAANVVHREIGRLLSGDTSVLSHRVDLTLVESPFRREALKRLHDEVVPGEVVTYQALAATIGAASAQRAVGGAMASNPVPIYVPCHRVIRSDGSIGNYGGGPSRKIKLLRAEGFEIDSANRLGASAVWGHRATHIFCRPECRAAQRANRSNIVIFADADHARKAGMRPCRLCCPHKRLEH